MFEHEEHPNCRCWFGPFDAVKTLWRKALVHLSLLGGGSRCHHGVVLDGDAHTKMLAEKFSWN